MSMSYLVQISAGTLTSLTEDFHGFSVIKTNAGVVLQLGYDHFL